MQRKSKIALIMLCLLFASAAYAQQSMSFFDGMSKFINWVTHIDRVLLAIHDKEQLIHLNTLLGDVKKDIDRTSLRKSNLARHIDKGDLKNEATIKRLIKEVSVAQLGIDTLLNDLNKLKALVNDNQTNSVIDSLQDNFETRKEKLLDDIKYKLNSKAPINKQGLVKEAQQAKAISRRAAESIITAMNKISAKIQK